MPLFRAPRQSLRSRAILSAKQTHINLRPVNRQSHMMASVPVEQMKISCTLYSISSLQWQQLGNVRPGGVWAREV